MLEIQVIETSTEIVNKLHKKGEILKEGLLTIVDDEQGFYILRSETGASALGISLKDSIRRVDVKGIEYQGMKPRDAEQSCFFYALKNFALVVGLGEAGTGKTTLALAYALTQLFRNDMNVVLVKPTTFVGRKSNAIAAVPGDHREKLEGYISSYLVVLKRIFGNSFEHQLFQLEEEDKLSFMPLELVRGIEFKNSVVIIDEAQNTSPHELLSLISRVSEDSQCIVLGDPNQVDTDIPRRETGLYVLSNSDAFIESPFSAGIRLRSQHRGPLATLVSEIIQELYEED